jgi:hypothetical protein
MQALLPFHALCASRGDGLLPELVSLLERPPAAIETSLEIVELIRDHGEREHDVPAPSLSRLPAS